MKIISVRENPEYKDETISYLQESWQSVLPILYEDCISHCINTKSPLPHWYLLVKDEETIGCAGLITNDFVSRMDLYPWLCALFIDENHRGNSYGSLLMNRAIKDTKNAGFEALHLCTDHIGYYEKYGFQYIGKAYHPWGAESRIYQMKV